MKEVIMCVPFFVAHISILGNIFLKNFGNTFNTDIVVSGPNKLKTSIFNLEIYSQQRDF